MARRDYYDGALSHWCHAISSEFTTKLLTQAERDQGFYIEHNINALLWADAKTRSEIAIAGIQNGRFSPNETRGWENLDGYDGGDEFYIPLNMSQVSDAGEQETQQDDTELEAIRQRCHDLSLVAISKAINRMSIKATRTKANPIEEDFETLHEMVSEVLFWVEDRDKVATQYLDSLKAIPPDELRDKANELADTMLNKVLSK